MSCILLVAFSNIHRVQYFPTLHIVEVTEWGKLTGYFCFGHTPKWCSEIAVKHVYQQVSTTRALQGAGSQMKVTSLYLGKLVKLLFLPFLPIYEVSFML